MKNRNAILYLTIVLAAGTIGTGCLYISIGTDAIRPRQGDNGAGPGVIVDEPAPNSGTLPIVTTGFTGGNPGSTDCFPAANGWNAFYVVTAFFWGPFSSEPLSAPFPNANNKAHLTIDTLATQNGTTLDTGVLIARDAMPNQKVCNDDAAPPFSENAKLSSATFTNLVSGKRYRVTIFYKTNTAAGLTTIAMNWTYH